MWIKTDIIILYANTQGTKFSVMDRFMNKT